MSRTFRWAQIIPLAIPSLLQGVTGAAAQSRPTIRDSGGVRIVDYQELAQTPARIKIDPEPIFDFAGLRQNPMEEFDAGHPFLIPRPLQDGRWVVVDMSALKIFDQSGRYVRSIGRRGSGPGEFRQIRDVCVGPGDTLVAISFGDRRVSAFDSAGNHVRTATIAGLTGANACFADASFLVRGMPVTNPASRLSRQEAFLRDRVTTVDRVSWDGTKRQSLGQLQSSTQERTFEDVPNIAVGHERIFVGNGTEPEYRVYSTSGALLRIVRWKVRRERITNDMRSVAMRRGYAAGPLEVDYLPVYMTIQPGPQDVVWIQDYAAPPARPKGYTVFDRDGEWHGRVELPILSRYRSDIQWIGTDRVVLMWRDEDGGPHLTLHRLIPR